MVSISDQQDEDVLDSGSESGLSDDSGSNLSDELNVDMEEEDPDEEESSSRKRKRGNDAPKAEGEEGPAGLADVMSKILGSTKPKKKASKAIILSRAKKDPAKAEAQQERKQSARSSDKDLKLENLNRIKPDRAVDFQLERQLTQIATKGVVRLFNAVMVQQKLTTIKKESKLNSTRSKVKTKDEDHQQFDNIISLSSDK